MYKIIVILFVFLCCSAVCYAHETEGINEEEKSFQLPPPHTFATFGEPYFLTNGDNQRGLGLINGGFAYYPNFKGRWFSTRLALGITMVTERVDDEDYNYNSGVAFLGSVGAGFGYDLVWFRPDLNIDFVYNTHSIGFRTNTSVGFRIGKLWNGPSWIIKLLGGYIYFPTSIPNVHSEYITISGWMSGIGLEGQIELR